MNKKIIIGIAVIILLEVIIGFFVFKINYRRNRKYGKDYSLFRKEKEVPFILINKMNNKNTKLNLN